MNITALLAFLSGKKTYLTIGIAFVLLFCQWEGWIKMPPEFYAALAALALAFLRSAVANVGTEEQPVAIKPASTAGTGASALIAILFAGALVAGCTSSQQRVAFNTLYSVEQTTTAAVDAYDSQVIKGSVPTNDVPRVSAAFNTFQAAFLIALDAARYNTNAIAPPNLVIEGQDVLNLITSIENK